MAASARWVDKPALRRNLPMTASTSWSLSGLPGLGAGCLLDQCTLPGLVHLPRGHQQVRKRHLQGGFRAPVLLLLPATVGHRRHSSKSPCLMAVQALCGAACDSSCACPSDKPVCDSGKCKVSSLKSYAPGC